MAAVRSPAAVPSLAAVPGASSLCAVESSHIRHEGVTDTCGFARYRVLRDPGGPLGAVTGLFAGGAR
jgi:hypothetical protein